MKFKTGSLLTAAAVALALSPISQAKEEETQQSLQELVDRSAQVVVDFSNAKQMDHFRELMKTARGVFVSPRITTLGLIVAGSAGQGVALVRGADGGWSQPAFYRYKQGSIGLQAGGQDAAVIMLMMSDAGVQSVLSEGFKMGADVSVSAGYVGGGASGSQKDGADIVSYSISEGLFAGVSLSGGQIDYRKGWNSTYYGSTVPGPRDILVDGKFSSEGSQALIDALTSLSN